MGKIYFKKGMDCVEKAKKYFDKVLEFMTAAFVPFVTVLAAAGILKGIVLIFSMIGILSDTSDTFLVFMTITDACFYFLPVFLAINISNYFNCETFVHALIALVLIFPGMIALLGKEGGLSFLGFKVADVDYANMLFPVLIGVLLSCLLEKTLNRFMPELLKGFITPMLVLLIMIPVVLVIIGPIGGVIGTAISDAFVGLYEMNPIICGAIVAPSFMLLSLFGLHWFLAPVMINNIALIGLDPFLGMCAMTAWVCFGISTALFIRSSDVESKGKSLGAAFPAIFGICDPVVFGLLVPYKKPLLLAVILESIGGAFIGGFNVQASGFAPPGPSSTPLFIGHGALPLLIVGIIIAILGFIGMWMLGYTSFPEVTSEVTEEIKLDS